MAITKLYAVCCRSAGCEPECNPRIPRGCSHPTPTPDILTIMPPRSATLAALCSICFAAPAAAQFTEPVQTSIRARIVGVVTSEEGAPTIDSGDEIAAIFNGEIVGLQRFGQPADGEVELSLTVFGDDPETQEVEGPPLNSVITFQFFDQSTGMTRNNVVALNTAGEVSAVRFEGEDIDLGIPDSPLPDDLLTPVQEFDLRLTAQDGSPGDGGGGNGGGGGGNPDVNGDGVVNKRDAALVLRVLIGATRLVSQNQVAAADVNGDGAITIADAIEVIRQQ